jgi:hypothetical protein
MTTADRLLADAQAQRQHPLRDPLPVEAVDDVELGGRERLDDGDEQVIAIMIAGGCDIRERVQPGGCPSQQPDDSARSCAGLHWR